MDAEVSLCVVDNEVNISSATEETTEATNSITGADEETVEESEQDTATSSSIVQIDEYEEQEADDEAAREPAEHFIVSSTDEMTDILDDYFDRTNSHFVIQKKSKYFGMSAADCDLSGHQVQWMDMQKKHGHYTDVIVQFDGVPHICVGNMYLNCQFGYDSSLAKKIKRKEMREKGELDNIKSRNLKTPSKKCGCPATIVVRQIVKFPEFKIEKDTEWRRRDGAGRLKAKIRDDRENLKTEVVIIGRLPNLAEHKYHEILEGHLFSKEMIHRDIIIKVQDLFLENKSHHEIREAVHQFAINEKFSKEEEIDFNRRRFFPQMKDIHNIVIRFRPLCRFTPDDESEIKTLMEAVKTFDEKVNIDFQVNDHDPKTNTVNIKTETSSDDEAGNVNDKETTKLQKKKEKMIQTFLLTFQTSKQQRLMRKFCQVAYILEVQQKPIRRCISYRLYLIMAQTNLDFQVIGSIVSSKPRTDGLIEGLKMLKDWNPCWNPKYFLVDCSQVIYDAVSTVFPDSNYFLNPTSCESKWQDVTSSPTNDLVEHSEEVLSYLKNMQYALTEDALNIAAAYLEASEIWQNSEKLRTWFLTSWLPVAKMWVYGYRPEDLLITHHVRATLNKCVQPYQEVLSSSAKLNGLIEFLKKLTLDISEIEYQNYVTANNEQYIFFQTFVKSNFYSEFMQGIPMSLVPYTEGICKIAESNVFNIVCGNLGVFSVQAAIDKNMEESELIEIAETKYGSLEYPKLLDSKEYTVSFGDSNSYPFCTCAQWLYYRIPCVHMFAIICNVPGWKFDMLSPLYRFSPVFVIDTSCVHHPINSAYEDIATQVENSTYDDVETQTEDNSKIFTFPFHNAGLDILKEQKKKTKKALTHLKDISYMFKRQSLYDDMCNQMEELLDEIEKEIELAQKDMCMIKDWLSIDNTVVDKEQTYIKTSLLTAGEKSGEMYLTPVLAPIGRTNNLEFLQQVVKKVDNNSTIIKVQSSASSTNGSQQSTPPDNSSSVSPVSNPTNIISPVLNIMKSAPNGAKKVLSYTNNAKNVLPVSKNITIIKSGSADKNQRCVKLNPPEQPVSKKRKLPTVNISNYKNIFKCDNDTTTSNTPPTTPLTTKNGNVKKEKTIQKINITINKKDENDKDKPLKNTQLSVLSILPRMNKGAASDAKGEAETIPKNEPEDSTTKEINETSMSETQNKENKSVENLDSETNDSSNAPSFSLEPAKSSLKTESVLADETVKKIESIINKLELDAIAMKNLSCNEVITKDPIDFLVCNEKLEGIDNITPAKSGKLTEIKTEKPKTGYQAVSSNDKMETVNTEAVSSESKQVDELMDFCTDKMSDSS